MITPSLLGRPSLKDRISFYALNSPPVFFANVAEMVYRGRPSKDSRVIKTAPLSLHKISASSVIRNVKMPTKILVISEIQSSTWRAICYWLEMVVLNHSSYLVPQLPLRYRLMRYIRWPRLRWVSFGARLLSANPNWEEKEALITPHPLLWSMLGV